MMKTSFSKFLKLPSLSNVRLRMSLASNRKRLQSMSTNSRNLVDAKESGSQALVSQLSQWWPTVVVHNVVRHCNE